MHTNKIMTKIDKLVSVIDRTVVKSYFFFIFFTIIVPPQFMYYFIILKLVSTRVCNEYDIIIFARDGDEKMYSKKSRTGNTTTVPERRGDN